MKIIEVEGTNIKPITVDSIQIFAAQRYSFVVSPLFCAELGFLMGFIFLHSYVLIDLLTIIGSVQTPALVTPVLLVVSTQLSCAITVLRMPSQILHKLIRPNHWMRSTSIPWFPNLSWVLSRSYYIHIQVYILHSPENITLAALTLSGTWFSVSYVINPCSFWYHPNMLHTT